MVKTLLGSKKFNLKNIVHPAHQMVHVLFISSLLYSFIGCAPKDKQSKAKLNIVSSLVMNNLNMNGGAVIYGQRTDAAGNWGRIFLPGDDFVVEMPFGLYNFSVVTYSGPNLLDGTIECSSANNVNIAEEDELVNLTVSQAQCLGIGLKKLEIKLCTEAQFQSATPLSACDNTGGINSLKIRLKSYQGSQELSRNLTSKCITKANFNINKGPFLPTGLGNIQKQPIGIRGFSNGDCTGDSGDLNFTQSLSQSPNTSTVLSLPNTPSKSSLTLLLNNSGAGIDVIPPTLSILSNAYLFNSKWWINSGNVSSLNINGNCEKGLPVDLYLEGDLQGSASCVSGTYLFSSIDMSGRPDTATTPYKIEIKQTDDAGNVGVQTLDLFKDTRAPSSGTHTSISPSSTPEYTDVSDAALGSNGGSEDDPLVIQVTPGSDTNPGFKNINIYSFQGLNCPSGGGTLQETVSYPSTSFSLKNLATNQKYSFKITTTDSVGNESLPGVCFGNIAIDRNPPLPPTSLALQPVLIADHTNLNAPSFSWNPATGNEFENAHQNFKVFSGNGCIVGQELSTQVLQNTASTASYGSNLSDGQYSFSVETVDIGANANGVCSDFHVDTTPPNAPTFTNYSSVINGGDGVNYINTPQITVNFTAGSDGESGVHQQKVKFFNSTNCIGSALKETVTVSAGATSATTSGLTAGASSDGSYSVILETIDKAGNSKASVCINDPITRDTVSPVTASNFTLQSSKYDKNLNVSWSNDPSGVEHVTLILYFGSSCSGSPLDISNGFSSFTNYTHSVNTAGKYHIQISSTDYAGNSSVPLCKAVVLEQASMGIGGDFHGAFFDPSSQDHLFAITKSGVQSLDISQQGLVPIPLHSMASRTPTYELSGFKNGNAKIGGAGFHNDHIYTWGAKSGGISNDLNVYSTISSSGSKEQPVFVGTMNAKNSEIVSHTFSNDHLWLLNKNGEVSGVSISTPGTQDSANDVNKTLIREDCVDVAYHSNSQKLFFLCGNDVIVRSVGDINTNTDLCGILSTSNTPGKNIIIDGNQALITGETNNYQKLTLNSNGDITGFSGENTIMSFSFINNGGEMENPSIISIETLDQFDLSGDTFSGCFNTSMGAFALELHYSSLLPHSVIKFPANSTCTAALFNQNEIFGVSKSRGIRRSTRDNPNLSSDPPSYGENIENIAFTEFEGNRFIVGVDESNHRLVSYNVNNPREPRYLATGVPYYGPPNYSPRKIVGPIAIGNEVYYVQYDSGNIKLAMNTLSSPSGDFSFAGPLKYTLGGIPKTIIRAKSKGSTSKGTIIVGDYLGKLHLYNLSSSIVYSSHQLCASGQEIVSLALTPNEDRLVVLCRNTGDPKTGKVLVYSLSGNTIDLGAPSGSYQIAGGGYNIERVAAYGNAIYVSNNNNGTQVLNATTLSSISYSSNINGNTAMSIKVVNHHLYIGKNQGGFSVYDLSNPLNPSLLNDKFDQAIAGDVNSELGFELVPAATGDPSSHFLYIGTGGFPISGGLQVIDITDPSNPSQ